jgi:hypothetical protein
LGISKLEDETITLCQNVGANYLMTRRKSKKLETITPVIMIKVSVTTAQRVLTLRMDERLPDMEDSCE